MYLGRPGQGRRVHPGKRGQTLNGTQFGAPMTMSSVDSSSALVVYVHGSKMKDASSIPSDGIWCGAFFFC